MSHIPKVMDAFAQLLAYPGEHSAQTAELLYVVLNDELSEAAREIGLFGLFVEQHSGWEVEEAFTGTFDVNPQCALEVGWHLFGEEYARGMFLVRMREELRRFHLPESSELPDHISHVLAVVKEMPEDEAQRFVCACVQPAVEKMDQALAKKDSPYRHVVAALAEVLKQSWGGGPSSTQHDILQSRPANLDPLHAMPVAAVGCGDSCGGDCAAPDVVQLDASAPSVRPPQVSENAED